MDEARFKVLYKELVGDQEFDVLELGLSHPNIFDVLKITHSEIRHTNFLGWLLDPGETHGLGDLLLKRFLREIFSDERAKDLSEFDVEFLDLTSIDVRREWKNIDLLIVASDVVICIENKIYAKEHSGQLGKYKSTIDASFPNHRKAFVYLTLFGENSEADDSSYINYSHEALIDLLYKVSGTFKDRIAPSVLTYLNDYIISIKRNFMKTDHLNELAKRVYTGHKEIFDFVFDNRPDFAEELREIISKRVEARGWIVGSENKGYVRFLTPELDKIIPRGLSTGWPKKEAFLFEINFFWYPKKMKLETAISPSDDSIHETLRQILAGIPGAKKPQGKKWLKHFVTDEDFDKEKLGELESSEIEKIVDGYLAKFETAIVNPVSKEIVKNKSKIKP